MSPLILNIFFLLFFAYPNYFTYLCCRLLTFKTFLLWKTKTWILSNRPLILILCPIIKKNYQSHDKLAHQFDPDNFNQKQFDDVTYKKDNHSRVKFI